MTICPYLCLSAMGVNITQNSVQVACTQHLQTYTALANQLYSWKGRLFEVPIFNVKCWDIYYMIFLEFWNFKKKSCIYILSIVKSFIFRS